ncbi:amino acid ABC transporter permease [Clostridium bowmanii]|uniref:amino acid ABC transporter permease n=1 Tax=Clostridium bowmanii TaxID=132925 RepID=UPI001C0BFC42|nr:amino acid ABC transporter permease [Clostridium bowmanii]MBU3188310.1 amino acid ABC transporter permease [Clostridium bowmanii]MCA1072698.1 amino acid ABC transporter permease [Clostridium bowmanii]
MTGLLHSITTFFTTVVKFAPKFVPGVIWTLELAFFSILLGTLLGLIVAMLKLTNKKYLTVFVDLYVTIVRGTPLLLQLYFIFYGLPNMGIMIASFPSAVIGLSLHNGAYISEIFRGAIESIDFGQREAARSLGMSRWQAMQRVVLPQAFKRSIPALGNQFIIAIKDSSLASVITITEIMLLAKQYSSVTYDVFPIFFIAGVYYLAIILVVTKLLKKIELKLKISER